MNDAAGVGDTILEDRVRPEWIDFNGHMSVSSFAMAFDLAIDTFWLTLGVDDEYRARTGCSTFAAESHFTYQRELKEGAPIRFTLQLLGYDDKRVHHFYRLYHAEEGYLASTGEWMNLHVDLNARRVSPMPEFMHRQLEEVFERHRDLPWPDEAGRPIRRPKYSAWSAGEGS